MAAAEPWNCSGSSLVEEAMAMVGDSPAAAADEGEGRTKTLGWFLRFYFFRHKYKKKEQGKKERS